MARHDTTDETRGSPENLDPRFSGLAKALAGIDFPQDKEGLYDHAEENDADDEVLEMIDDLPDQEYRNMADVMAATAGREDDYWEGRDKSPDDFDYDED